MTNTIYCFACVALFLFGLASILGSVLLVVATRTFRRKMQIFALMSVGVMISWLGAGLAEHVGKEKPQLFRPCTMPALHSSAFTDQGRRVKLFYTVDSAEPSPEMLADESRFLQSLGQNRQIEPQAQPDQKSNCHGWIFTGGRYWVVNPDLEMILEDNGYEQVSVPQRGDLAVYRTKAGRIDHTGIVHAVPPFGSVLVESKWAWRGRYVHPAEAVLFGPNYTFYRSSRSGHLLRGLEHESIPSPSKDDIVGRAAPTHQ